MPDREKVMQWLETCVSGCEEGCPYEYKNLVYRVECKADLMRDALALLKEQEPIAPDYRQVLVGSNGAFVLESHCGACGCGIMKNDRWRTKYCPECGKKVKWDAETSS